MTDLSSRNSQPQLQRTKSVENRLTNSLWHWGQERIQLCTLGSPSAMGFEV